MQEKQIKIAYCRVSSVDDRQKLGLEVQTEALKHCDYLFKERHSGSDDNRKEFNKSIKLAKKLAGSGNQVSFCVYKMDRLSRKTSTLLKVVEELIAHKIEFVSMKENINTSTPSGILMYQMLSIFAEFELNNLKMRTREGLSRAKANGVKLGNKGISTAKEERIADLYQCSQLSIKEIAKNCEVCEKTVYNVAKRLKLSRK